MWSAIGLVVFVLIVLGHVVALAWDAKRAITGETTFTQWITQKSSREWIVIASIALADVVGLVGLTVHFLTFQP